MPSQPLPNPSPRPEDFSVEKFKKKSGFRDYVIYVSLLAVVLGLAGGAIYYYTRPPAQQNQLQGKLEQALDKAGLVEDEKMRVATLKQPKLDGLLGPEPEVVPPAPNTGAQAQPEPVAGSAYAGGSSRVLLSDDANAPKASPEFIKFAQNLKVGGVVAGDPAKAILNGRLFRAGDEIDLTLAVIFKSVDGGTRKSLTLRDKTGAELRVTY